LVPFNAEWVPLAWKWMNQSPMNFDDYGPKTIEEFSADLLKRHQAGQIIVAVLLAGEPVGIIGFQPVTPRLGHFSGICFAAHAQGNGLGTEATRTFIEALWLDGYEKIEAMFFAENERVAAMFRKLGAHDEGLLYEHTLRAGRPVDMKIVGLLKSGGK
jgi:RimJ/RimL family protein N-acetyltransferase